MVKMSSNYVIETKQVTKCFDKLFKKSYAVNKIDMHVKKGSIYGLIGKNGAGKTSLMKMICGLSNLTEGEIYLFGDNASNKGISYNRL